MVWVFEAIFLLTCNFYAIYFCCRSGGERFLLDVDLVMCALSQITSQSPDIKSKTIDPKNADNIFTARYLMWYVLFHANILIILTP